MAYATKDEPAPGTDEAVEVSALSFAARLGDLKEVRRLMQDKADPNACDAVGETPLFEAAASGNVSVVATLLLAGADPSHESLLGSSASDLATDSTVRSLLRLCTECELTNADKRNILNALVPDLRLPVKKFMQSLCADSGVLDFEDEDDDDDEDDDFDDDDFGYVGRDEEEEDYWDIAGGGAAKPLLNFSPKPRAITWEPPKPVVDVELVVSHAIQEGQITLSLKSNNTFAEVKKAIADYLTSKGQQVNNLYLVRKERDAYQAYKDKDMIGDVRQVRMVGASLPPADTVE